MERFSSFHFCTPSGGRTAKPWRGYLLKKRRRSRAINFYHIRATLPKFEFAEGTTRFMWFWQTTIGSVVKVVEVADLLQNLYGLYYIGHSPWLIGQN